MSAEALKQLKIKTSMLKRLRKEYESYQKEAKTIQNKIDKLEAELYGSEQKEELEIQVRKNVPSRLLQKEFLNES